MASSPSNATTPTSKTTRRSSSSSSSPATVTADVASWYCAAVLLVLILMASVRESSSSTNSWDSTAAISGNGEAFRGTSLLDQRHCDEIYVVGDGETLHTISDKCGDPFIVERNPHIHDPDDVFPGLVIKIVPAFKR